MQNTYMDTQETQLCLYLI